MLQVNISNPLHAAFLENHVPYYIWKVFSNWSFLHFLLLLTFVHSKKSIFIFLIFIKMQAFITQDSADRDYLFKNLRSFDVAVINHVADERRNPEELHISQQACEYVVSLFILF